MTTPTRKRNTTLNSDILIPAIWQSVIKLDPRWMWRNPVMFVVEIGAVLTLMLTISPTIFGGAAATSGYNLLVTVILVLTVIFANYAEAVAEGRGRAQAATLRKTKKETPAKRVRSDGSIEMVTSSDLRKGDVVYVETTTSFRATATSFGVSPTSTKRPSPVSQRQFSRSRVLTHAARSRVARR